MYWSHFPAIVHNYVFYDVTPNKHVVYFRGGWYCTFRDVSVKWLFIDGNRNQYAHWRWTLDPASNYSWYVINVFHTHTLKDVLTYKHESRCMKYIFGGYIRRRKYNHFTLINTRIKPNEDIIIIKFRQIIHLVTAIIES